MMELIFARFARAEMAEAKRYYERQQRGLGMMFQHEAAVSAKRILEQPLAWQVEIDPVSSHPDVHFAPRCGGVACEPIIFGRSSSSS